MKKGISNLSSLSIVALISGFSLFAASGCVKQEASKIEDINNPSTTAPAVYAEIDVAQKIIEKMPEAANGFMLTLI